MVENRIRALLRKPGLAVTLLITLLVIFVAIGMNIMSARSFYRLGLDPYLPNDFFNNLPRYLIVYLLFMFFAVILLGVRLFLQIRRFGLRNSLLHICCITVSVSTIVLCNLINKPGIWYIMEGFRERVQQYIDVETIRQWAETYDIKKQTTYKEVDKSHWPRTLWRLAPNTVNIHSSTTSDYKVYAVWGGPFGHWGLVVGPENMPFPGSETHRGGEWRTEFSKGVYLWYEIR